MAGLYDLLTRPRPNSAADELNQPQKKPQDGGLSTVDTLKIRPRFDQYKADGGEMSWDEYAMHFKSTGTLPKSPTNE